MHSTTLLSILFLSLTLFITACTSTSSEEKPTVTSTYQPELTAEISHPGKLDAILNHYIDKGSYPLLYARLENLQGEVIYEHSAVNKELLPETEVTGDTWFRIWSMSKIVTISTFMDLVEDGLVKLNDPVTKYIPEFADLQVATNAEGVSIALVEDPEEACPMSFTPMKGAMLVRHLIDHEAGFFYSTTGRSCIDSLGATRNYVRAKDSEELIKIFAETPLVQHPGESHHYGTNTTILGLVAERATGKSLKQLVEERLTSPAGIAKLRYGLPDGEVMLPRVSGKPLIEGGEEQLRIAKDGELDIFGPEVPDYEPDHALYLGGEGMIGTSEAYLDYLRLLLNRGVLNGYRFLEDATIDSLTAPRTQLENPWGNNGMNLWVTSDTLRDLGTGDEGLWQGGGYEGTNFWIDPKRGIVGVVMSQIWWIPNEGWKMYDDFRGELYRQFFAAELESKRQAAAGETTASE